MSHWLSCPHCNAQTIDAEDKLECGMFGPPCKCSACGGYSRELKWPRLRISLLLYVAPYFPFLLLPVLWSSSRSAGSEQFAAIIMGMMIVAALVWQNWLVYVIEARLTRQIPLRPVTPTRLWIYWSRFKQVCAWSFFMAVFGTLMFVWFVNHQ